MKYNLKGQHRLKGGDYFEVGGSRMMITPVKKAGEESFSTSHKLYAMPSKRGIGANETPAQSPYATLVAEIDECTIINDIMTGMVFWSDAEDAVYDVLISD